ncbi:MAG: DUF4430 domain-containing protein [Clostridia bacterium]|nr:DUF4430 domain-containing protein [Clostridia bacterium]
MKNTITTKLALILVIVMMITLCSCDLFKQTTTTSFVAEEEGQVPEIWENATYTKDTELGEGSKTFLFKVDAEGYAITFTIHTDAETVGAALLALELIAGEDSQYGLYVKTVNGILADYDVDGTYWAFYENGEYAMSGVDTTAITEGQNYSFVRAK